MIRRHMLAKQAGCGPEGRLTRHGMHGCTSVEQSNWFLFLWGGLPGRSRLPAGYFAKRISDSSNGSSVEFQQRPSRKATANAEQETTQIFGPGFAGSTLAPLTSAADTG